ncbi:MAG: hypothetical protein PHP86_17585 [Nevskiales bacterium]|nr:hypothetical protein [Nevskiales bacterium]
MAVSTPAKWRPAALWGCVWLAALGGCPAGHAAAPDPSAAQPRVRELSLRADVKLSQTWQKNDPEHPGSQWSRATGAQHYEIRTRLRSDGELQVRNLLDPDLERRLEAKVIHLARQAQALLARSGQGVRIPRTAEEKAALTERMQAQMSACRGDMACRDRLMQLYTALFAAMQYPEALQPDTIPGRYLYFLPYDGCPWQSQVTMRLEIEGVRYNRSRDAFVPFSERRQGDSRDIADGSPPCTHYVGVVDTEDSERGMYQETVYIPSPVGETVYTEDGSTTRREESQPLPSAVLDWINHRLRHAPESGTAEARLALPLSLNGNSTWLGLWEGVAEVRLEWRFEPVDGGSGHADGH